MAKKILVLGARGYLGEHIVYELAAAKYDVAAWVRPGTTPSNFPEGVEVLEGNLQTDADLLRRALDRVDAVIFSAGRTWQPGLPMSEYHRQNVAITKNFFTALGVRPHLRVVFTSSMSTIAGSSQPVVYREDTGRAGISEALLTPYDRAKIACEAIALDNARRGNQVVILNPGLLLGPGASPTSYLAAPFQLLWLAQGKMPFYVNGGASLCDVRDVARAHVAALERGLSGQRYILAGHNVDRREFYRRVAALTGIRPPWTLPCWFVTMVMTAADSISFLTRGLCSSPIHRSFARYLGLYVYGSSDKAAAELGYTIRPLDTIILDMLRHYQSSGLLPTCLSYLAEVTPENATAFILLKQVAQDSGFARFLWPRLQQIHRICQANHALKKALTGLLTTAAFDPRRCRFTWDSRTGAADYQTLRRFVDYLYFASDEFLREIPVL